LRFLSRFPSQDKADWLTPVRLENWLRAAGYNNPRTAPALHAHLAGAALGTIGPHAAGQARVRLALVAALGALREQIRALEEAIAVQLAEHPDAPIFTSLPRSGTVRAARLLAEIGDARGRYPTPESLVCLAGAAPSARQSGKHKVVSFRWAVDKQLRGAVIDFAGDSHHANPWAADLYTRARNRGHDHPTPSASSPAPGCTSSGAVGKTASPTTPPNTAVLTPCWTTAIAMARPPDLTSIALGALDANDRRATAKHALQKAHESDDADSALSGKAAFQKARVVVEAQDTTRHYLAEKSVTNASAVARI
jgi:hypothetical protein